MLYQYQEIQKLMAEFLTESKPAIKALTVLFYCFAFAAIAMGVAFLKFAIFG